MPYTATTFAQLKTQLANRLGDSLKVFWVDTELGILLTESLRTFGLCSGFWRERGVLASFSGTAFYDLGNLVVAGVPLVGYTVTDQDLIQAIQYHLLENASSQAAWGGTEQFTLDDVTRAIERRRNQFLSDTGAVVTVSTINIAPPPSGRTSLAPNIIDVRRAAWRGAAPLNYFVPLWREDERLLTAANQDWSVSSGTPEAYSIMAPQPLTLQLAPPPVASGQLELLTVNSGATLNPSAGATILGIPDDLTPGIKWGALADLLGKDGIACDPVRAQYAEERYQIYVKLARVLPVVIHAEINGVPLIPSTLQEVESSTPGWENISGAPADLILAAPNLIGLSPVPDGAYSVTADVVRRTPVYTNADPVQIGQEQLDAILDYAEHLALFKCAGAEWHSTDRAAQNFMLQAITYNQRMSASARSSVSAAMQSQRQKEGTPRRSRSGSGVGAVKVGADA